MKAEDPRHGTRPGYLAHRRDDEDPCDPCKAAHTAWTKRYKLAAQRNGGRTTIDPAPAKAHIELLLTRMTLSCIAALSNSSATHLRTIVEGEPAPMRADLAARLFAVKLDTCAAGHLVDATGARRRLQGLALLGFSFERLASMTGGCSGFNLREIANGNRTRTTFERAEAIKATTARIIRSGRAFEPRDRYERAGAARLISRAKKARWVSVLAWDDDTIDDPAAKPTGLTDSHRAKDGLDEAAIQQRINGIRTAKTSGKENVEVVRRMIAAGWSQNGIRRHTGLKVERYLDRAEVAA